jgi:hypothetical protein
LTADDQPPPETPAEEGDRARRARLVGRLLLSAFAGGMTALSLTADPRGFWDGALIGVGTQVLIRGLVGLLLGGRQDTFWGLLVSTAAGAAVGAGVASLAAREHFSSLMVVGALVGVVDTVVSWVFAPGRPPPAHEDVEEPMTDLDADLRDDAGEE